MTNERQVPTIVVDRGEPVIVTAVFESNPDELYFSYTRPGEERPYVDDGFGQPRSKIECLKEGAYRYVISTKDFAAGEGWIKFSAEWDGVQPEGYDETVLVGKYVVRGSPPQLP